MMAAPTSLSLPHQPLCTASKLWTWTLTAGRPTSGEGGGGGGGLAAAEPCDLSPPPPPPTGMALQLAPRLSTWAHN